MIELQAVVLVTLGGCHLLYSLVVCPHCEARKKIVRCSGEVIVRGIAVGLEELQPLLPLLDPWSLS